MLALYQTEHFELHQIESIRRQQSIYIVETMISIFDRIENIVGKGENAGNQLFHPFSHYVFRNLSSGLLKFCRQQSIYMAETMISIFDRIENIVGKGENAGNQLFHPFSHYDFRNLSSGLLKFWILC